MLILDQDQFQEIDQKTKNTDNIINIDYISYDKYFLNIDKPIIIIIINKSI